MSKTLLRFGSFEADTESRTLRRDGSVVPLTNKEFDTLQVLLDHPGQIVPKKLLVNSIWDGRAVSEGNLPRQIKNLRQKLSPEGETLIQTYSGQGYSIKEVTAVTVSDPPDRRPTLHEISDAGESGSAPETQAGHLRKALSSYRGAVWALIAMIGLAFVVYSSLHWRKETLLVTSMNQLTDDGNPKRGPLLFDGSRIWFEEELEATWRVVSVAAGGGDVTPLETPMNDVYLEDVAVDGSALLLSAAGGNTRTLWSWPLAGGSPRVLPHQPGPAAWTPDKRSIAFGDIDRLILATEAIRPSFIPMPPGTIIRSPRWSSDSEHITFQLMDRKTGESRLWFSDGRGRNIRPVPGAKDTGEDQARGIWTRDGRYYVFSGGSRTMHDLWALHSPEGFFGSRFAKASRLTHGPANWDWPTPGRNTGDLFAMSESIRGKLVSLPRGGSGWRSYLGGVSAYELDFSRDGKWVVYVRYPDHTIWRSRVDGSDNVQLTSTELEAHQPHWSPDGARIAFMGQRPGAHWRVMILEPGGRIEEPFPAGEDQGVPTWSPDGRQLLYGDWPFGKNSPPMGLRILDLFAHRTARLEGSEKLWTPRWSPDGTWMSALRQDSSALMLTRAAKPSWHEIMTGEGLDNLTWSLDSRHIYLTAEIGQQIRRVNILTGRVEPIAEIRDFPAPHEQWFGVAPDGSPLALQGVREQEIYSLRWALP